MSHHDTGKWIEDAIRDWVNTSPENQLGNGERAWDDPLVGFSSGADAYWAEFKEHCGPYHWTPEEAFEIAFPGSAVPGSELTVVSWVLPQMKKTKMDTRKEKTYPPESWARARFFGEVVNEKLRTWLVSQLEAKGVRAVAPSLHPQWARKPSDKYTFSSTWSERHAAFVSGLGTFGLSDGLITPRGKAMRVGSVIAKVKIPATPRPYTGHRDYCLWFSEGTCKKCAERCPVGSLTDKGHDKNVCSKHVHQVCQAYITEHYGFPGYACGLCQTAVPCESGIPQKGKLKK